MLDIYSGNIIFEGYWKNSSSYEDIDPWSSRTKIQVQKWKFFNQKKKKNCLEKTRASELNIACCVGNTEGLHTLHERQVQLFFSAKLFKQDRFVPLDRVITILSC